LYGLTPFSAGQPPFKRRQAVDTKEKPRKTIIAASPTCRGQPQHCASGAANDFGLPRQGEPMWPTDGAGKLQRFAAFQSAVAASYDGIDFVEHLHENATGPLSQSTTDKCRQRRTL